MVTIRRFDIASAFRIGALLTALVWLISGVLWIGFYGMLISPVLFSSAYSGSEASMGFMGIGMGMMCVFFVGGGVFAAVGGGIGGALLAFAYNFTARWVGGLKVELEEDYEKAKRDFEF